MARNKYDKKHQTNLMAYSTKVDKLYRRAIATASAWSVDLHGFDRERPFSFADYPIVEKKAEKLISWLEKGLKETIEGGVRAAWALSTAKNDNMVRGVFGSDAPRRYMQPNEGAMKAFLSRRDGKDGLGLSDKVWDYSKRFRAEIELGLDLGIRAGRSADDISRDIRLFLNKPDKLFRRIRTEMVDSNGKPIWQMSKTAADYHPGAGVYRSSYKNARRLAVTECNMAYRKADGERWGQLDFVVGQHVIISNNHPVDDMCNELSGRDENDRRGRYPKDFVFTGWHPHCRCYCVPILATEEDMMKEKEAYKRGEEYTPHYDQIDDMPSGFEQWTERNRDKISNGLRGGGGLPYFVRDNRERVETVLGEE